MQGVQRAAVRVRVLQAARNTAARQLQPAKLRNLFLHSVLRLRWIISHFSCSTTRMVPLAFLKIGYLVSVALTQSKA